MAKPARPQVELPRALVPPAPRETAERFARTGKGSAPAAGEPAGALRRVHERKSGRRVQRTTLALSEELAVRLRVYAAREGVDLSIVTEAALRHYLDALGA